MIPDPGFQKPIPYLAWNRGARHGLARANLAAEGAVPRCTHGAGSKEVVDLLVEVDGAGKILLAAGLSLDKMVTVYLSEEERIGR